MGKQSQDRRKPLTIKQAAKQLNDILTRTIDAFALRPFMLREAEKFGAQTMDMGKEEYVYLSKPYGLALTPIGYWTDTATIYIKGDDPGHYVAEIHWSSGIDDAAGAELIYRASQATNALNLAFSQFAHRYRVVKDGETVEVSA